VIERFAPTALGTTHFADPVLTGWTNLWRASGAGLPGTEDSLTTLAIFVRM
jgi:hypothetical protein